MTITAQRPEPLLTRTDVAQWLGVPAQTLAVWANRGSGPEYHRVCRHVRYRRSTVEAWLQQHSKTPAT